MLLGLFDATGTLTGLTGLLVGLAGLVGLTPTAVLDGNASSSSSGCSAVFSSKEGVGFDGGGGGMAFGVVVAGGGCGGGEYLFLVSSPWTQHDPNMNPSMHMPRCFPSVLRHSHTNMQVPRSPEIWQVCARMW